jgi:hypothetical protein
MFVLHVAQGSADGRRRVSERDGTMTDISLQKTAETAGRSRGRPFPKGQSGNPAGRPRGSSNRATRAAEMLLDGEATALTRKAVELALAGDQAALRLCLDRTVAPRRERAVELALPPIHGADDILAAIKVVSGAVGRGAITPGEGFTLSQMMETFLRAIDASDFEGRLRQLEEDQAARREDTEARRYNWAGRFDSSSRRD